MEIESIYYSYLPFVMSTMLENYHHNKMPIIYIYIVSFHV